MPIIALPKSRPLANAPAPVRDNERRPTVNNSGVASAVAGLADANKQRDVPLSLADPYEQMGAVGRALQETGSAMGALALKQVEGEAIWRQAEARNAIGIETAKFQAWMRDNPDETTWEPKRSEIFTGLQKTLLSNPKLSAQAHNAIALELSAVDAESRNSVLLLSSKTTFAKADRALDAEIDFAKKSQNRPLYEAAYEKRFKFGTGEKWRKKLDDLDFDEEGKRQKQEAEAVAERAEIKGAQAQATLDPDGWLKANPKPWEGKEHIWRIAKNTADERKRENLTEAGAEIQDAFILGKIKTENDVERWGNPNLTPVQREKMKAIVRESQKEGYATALQQDRDVNGVRNAVVLGRAAKDFDPSTDPDGAKSLTLRNEIHNRVPAHLATGIVAELNAKAKGLPPPPIPDGVKRYVEKTIDYVFDPIAGKFPWQARVKQEDGKTRTVETDGAKREEAWRAETFVRDEFQKWQTANPEAAKDQRKVEEKLRSLMTDVGVMSVLDVVRPNVVPQASAKPLPKNTSSSTRRDLENSGTLPQYGHDDLPPLPLIP